MLGVKFRRTLRQEANAWRASGLINDDVYDRLATQYRFDGLESEAGGSFVTILIGLGAVLIGLGILSFVAANWQALSKVARIAVLLSGFLVVNISGFYLWQRANSHRLGQGLLLLGAMILGADMALLAQLFQISGDGFVLFMGWAIGVLLMAYALGLTSIGVMAIGLLGCGYWGAAQAGIDARSIAPGWAWGLYQYMPVWSMILFLPLAYRCRSPFIFLLGAIAWLSSFQFAATEYTFFGSSVDRPAVVLGCSLPPLLLWATGRLQSHFGNSAYRESFAHLSRRLAVFSGGLTCFVLSFDYFIPEILHLKLGKQGFIDHWSWDRLLWLGLAIGLWVLFARLTRRWQINDSLMLVLGLSTAGLLTVAGSIANVNWIPAMFFLLLAAITLTCIQISLHTGDRGAFYFGWLLLLIRVLSWFMFTQTDLMFKSLLFILSGVATIAVGLWFERRLKQNITAGT
jgi:uncharacterized membrane protein